MEAVKSFSLTSFVTPQREILSSKEALQNPCSQVELNKIVPFGFSLQRQKKMVFFLLSK